jgi:type IV secretion system protein VirB2
MSGSTSDSNPFRAVPSCLPGLLALILVAALVLLPDLAHATDTADAGGLPYEGPLKQLTKSIRGPVAFGISLIGIIAAGAVLIFGGEMSGFLRTLVFLVLIIAIVVNAAGMIKLIGGDAATIGQAESRPCPVPDRGWA